jgi:cytochrome o ubiquinol oxidase subunit 2
MFSFRLKHLRRLSMLLLSAVVLAGCSSTTATFLDPHGPIAASQRRLFFEIIGWMMIVVVPIFVLVPLFAWRYRRKNAASQYRPDWTFSTPLEFVVWGVPVAIVAILAVVILSKETQLDPYAAIPSQEPPLEVQVVGLDWKWLFIYPDQQIATVGNVALPSGRPVRFHLTSDSVMQSFFIPALGSQIYAMAGMVTKLNLKADRLGEIIGRNTQFNGTGFQNQHFTVSVLAPQDFAAWVAKVRSRGKPLNDAAYRVLSRRSTAAQAKAQLGMTEDQAAKSVLYFPAVKPNLFADIVDKYRHVAGTRRQHGS